MKLSFVLFILLGFANISNAQNFEQAISPKGIFINTEAHHPPSKKAIQYEVGRYEVFGDFQIFIPKSFSPNQDGINDVFKIQTTNVLDFKLTIFNQWGEYIFDSNNPNIEWDGKVSGKSLRKAPYVYIIQIRTTSGQSLKYSGCLLIEI